MKVLGLDPSLTNCGYAIYDSDNESNSCPLRGRIQTTSSMLEVDRYVFVREKVESLLKEVDVDAVATESPVYGASYSEGMYGLFLYVQEAVKSCRKDLVFLSVSQVKSHAKEILQRPTYWKMGKSDMVEAAKKDTRTATKWNHNEADAYLVAKMGCRFWMLFQGLIGSDDLTPYERNTFLREYTYTRGKKSGQTVRSGLLFKEGIRFHTWSKDGDEEEG